MDTYYVVGPDELANMPQSGTHMGALAKAATVKADQDQPETVYVVRVVNVLANDVL